MEVRFGMAKISKYAVSESGDTFEMVERPHGGISFVLVDGQRSGKSAKSVSNLVSRKAIQLLGEGVRDGAAARAAHDYLFTYRGGKVSATLNIISIDTESKSIVLSRNNEAPIMIYTPDSGLTLLDTPSRSLGTTRRAKPGITELPFTTGMIIVTFTDGLRHAGTLLGQEPFDYESCFRQMLDEHLEDPQVIADALLQGAVERDDGRPRDDISVFVIAILDDDGRGEVRRLSGWMPL